MAQTTWSKIKLIPFARKQYLRQHNTKNQKALGGQLSRTLGDDVAIHTNISMQLLVPTLQF